MEECPYWTGEGCVCVVLLGETPTFTTPTYEGEEMTFTRLEDDADFVSHDVSDVAVWESDDDQS
jgi:hypothetical protein